MFWIFSFCNLYAFCTITVTAPSSPRPTEAKPVKAVRMADTTPAHTSNISRVVTESTSYFANIEIGATVKAICDYDGM